MKDEIFEKRLMKPTEVAKILNISRSLVYRLMKQGKIPSIHINQTVRVHPQDLAVFIQENRMESEIISIPIDHGKLCLGTWQGIFLFEHRSNTQHRKISINCLQVSKLKLLLRVFISMVLYNYTAE